MFPEKVYTGDRLAYEWSSDADSAELNIRRRAEGAAETSKDAAEMTDSGFKVSLDTDGLTPGLWAYHLTETQDAETRTIAAGIVELSDALTPAKTHNEKMVALLEELLEGQIVGRGDVRFYGLGDRQVQAQKTGELREELERYRRAVDRERNPRRAFWYG